MCLKKDFLKRFIKERDEFELDVTGELKAPLPRGLVIDGPALLEALRTPESQCALLRAAQVSSYQLPTSNFYSRYGRRKTRLCVAISTPWSENIIGTVRLSAIIVCI